MISGIAFKGVPQTNDLRGSSAIKILEGLTEYASQITIHDFMNSQNEFVASKMKSIGPKRFLIYPQQLMTIFSF